MYLPRLCKHIRITQCTHPPRYIFLQSTREHEIRRGSKQHSYHLPFILITVSCDAIVVLIVPNVRLAFRIRGAHFTHPSVAAISVGVIRMIIVQSHLSFQRRSSVRSCSCAQINRFTISSIVGQGTRAIYQILKRPKQWPKTGGRFVWASSSVITYLFVWKSLLWYSDSTLYRCRFSFRRVSCHDSRNPRYTNRPGWNHGTTMG